MNIQNFSKVGIHNLLEAAPVVNNAIHCGCWERIAFYEEAEISLVSTLKSLFLIWCYHAQRNIYFATCGTIHYLALPNYGI